MIFLAVCYLVPIPTGATLALTATTAATEVIVSRAGFINPDLPSHPFRAVEGLYRLRFFLVGGHFHEAETAHFAGLAIDR
jgi:hypothetical protein